MMLGWVSSECSDVPHRPHGSRYLERDMLERVWKREVGKSGVFGKWPARKKTELRTRTNAWCLVNTSKAGRMTNQRDISITCNADGGVVVHITLSGGS